MPVDFNLSSHLFGPKLAHRTERFTPVVHLLFGGADAPLGIVAVSGPSSEDAVVIADGGDPDVNAPRHIGVRLIQAEYLMTHSRGSETQNNARIDEQTFRYNNGIDKSGDKRPDVERFDIALSQIAGKRLTFAEVTGKVGETAAN